jgi:hypothetical protein
MFSASNWNNRRSTQKCGKITRVIKIVAFTNQKITVNIMIRTIALGIFGFLASSFLSSFSGHVHHDRKFMILSILLVLIAPLSSSLSSSFPEGNTFLSF